MLWLVPERENLRNACASPTTICSSFRSWALLHAPPEKVPMSCALADVPFQMNARGNVFAHGHEPAAHKAVARRAMHGAAIALGHARYFAIASVYAMREKRPRPEKPVTVVNIEVGVSLREEPCHPFDFGVVFVYVCLQENIAVVFHQLPAGIEHCRRAGRRLHARHARYR